MVWNWTCRQNRKFALITSDHFKHSTMRLSIIQSSLNWENPAANRAMFTEKLAQLRGATDLVVLPEMFSTGFSMAATRLAEPMDGPTAQWMLATAAELNSAIAGSFICVENQKFYNRLLVTFPDGKYEYYDKKHLFGLAGEHEHFAAGNKKLVFEWKGFRICPMVCYDLRFPVWARNTPAKPYDLLLYVANWPSRRGHHWRSLLVARAIENQAFVVGVNIFGADGNGHDYSGDSAIYDYSGQQIVQISGEEGIFSTEISVDGLQQYRKQLPFLDDADRFELKA